MHLPRLGGSWRYWSYANMTSAEGQAVQVWAPMSLLNLVQDRQALEGTLVLPGGRELSIQGTIAAPGSDDSRDPSGPRPVAVHLVGSGGEARYELRGVLAPHQDQIVGLVASPGKDIGGRPQGTLGLFLMVRA